jgi:hypothetical protein
MLKVLKAFDKDNKTIKELKQLKKRPPPEKGEDMPRVQNFIPWYNAQADLIFLPTAKFGFKYLLVVVDLQTKKFDCEPLKDKDAHIVARAFSRIYERDILEEFPKILSVDSGSEFKGAFKELMDELEIELIVGAPGRHRMQGLVENKNSSIGKLIFSFLDYNELKKGKRSVDWYVSKDHFRKFVAELNKESKAKPTTENLSDAPFVSDANRDLLDVGQKVRVLLDEPIDIASRKKLGGKFRATDIRWSLDKKKIRWVVLNPGFPVMYRVSGEKFLRTRQQLQKV